MSSQICPKCGTNNPAEMRFCSNCGQTLSAPVNREEPPPTIFINQPPVNQKQTEFTPPAPQIPVNPTAQPPKKSSKAWIFGIAGCLGFLVISVIGLGVLVFALGYNSELFSEKQNNNRNYPTPPPNSNSKPAVNKKPLTSESPEVNQTDDESDSNTGNFLVTILQNRKQVGEFNQTAVKSLVTEDYFPQADGAAQAEYSNGSKYVYLTVGKFSSLSAAKKNFNDQISAIKNGSGKVTYENTAADGTISAIYNNNGFYFAEYCNTNNFCNRIHSDSQAALKSFFENYAQ